MIQHTTCKVWSRNLEIGWATKKILAYLKNITQPMGEN